MSYHRIVKYIFMAFLPAILLIVSCKDNISTEPVGAPFIEDAYPLNTYTGDIITFIGKNFGYKGDKRAVLFNDSLALYYYDCIKWNNSLIKFKLPLTASSGTFVLHVNGYMSNKVELSIDNLPPLEMVEINAGSFEIGSDNGLQNESPAHTIKLSRAFFISIYEVNQLLWQEVMSSNSSSFIGDELPVHNISWLEAVRFCNEFSRLRNYDQCYSISENSATFNQLANGYRLPTEAEWEYACRAGSTNDFSGTGNIDDMGWYISNSGSKPQPSGRKQANNFGLYDMHGNVWEWCWDFYSDDYYGISPDTDPLGPSSGTFHVKRGGAADTGIMYTRSSNRTFPMNSVSMSGLRVVRTKF